MEFIIISAALVATAAMGLWIWMLFVEPRRFRLRREEIEAAGEPEGSHLSIDEPRLEGLKILHITDTHFSGGETAKLRFLREVARESYDFVFFTGDLIDTPEGVASCVEAAGYFSARVGVFAVLGGHDYYRCRPGLGHLRLLTRGLVGGRKLIPNPASQLVAGLEQEGVVVLHDSHRVVTLPSGQSAAVVGLQDAFAFEPDYDAAWDGLEQSMPVIVMAHSPDVLDEISRRGVKLAFFGHTHGGQVRFPLVGAVVTRSTLPPRRSSGTFKEGCTVYTLNNGLGGSRPTHFRLLCRPEVTVLNIAPARLRAGAAFD